MCLNVGCIPSKALLHVAAVMDEVKHASDLGVTIAAPTVDIDKQRAHKDKVVGKLTGGLAAMAKMRKVTVVQGTGEFADPYHLKVVLAKDGSAQTIKFKQAIIAAGSEAVKLPFLPKDDPRIVTSTGALELRQRPKKMLVIGGGIIGLEMGTVYSTLGAKARRGRDARRPDAGRRPRPGQGLAEAERAALRQHHAEDQDRRPPRPQPMASASSSRAWTAPRAKASTTSCCRPWAARTTGAASPRKRPV